MPRLGEGDVSLNMMQMLGQDSARPEVRAFVRMLLAVWLPHLGGAILVSCGD